MTYLNKNYFGPDLSQLARDYPEAGDQLEKPEDVAAWIKEQEQAEASVVKQRERWMFCYRQGLSYATIDTNNFIESWHNTLKRHFKDVQK